MTNQLRTAAIVLAAGKGSRMTAGTPKVCRTIGGQPAINRMLTLFRSFNIEPCVVVVGDRADIVKRTIRRAFPDTLFTHQAHQHGTGDAAAYGVRALVQAGFAGDVCLTAGDKIIAPRALARLLREHHQRRSDLTIAVTRRDPNAFNGIILQDADHQAIRGILDEWDRRRLLVLGRLNACLSSPCAPERVRALIRAEFPERKAALYFPRLWETRRPLTAACFRRIIPDPLDRQGRLRIGRRLYDAETLFTHCPLANQSLYLFRFKVLQRVIDQLTRLSTGPEVYITDAVALLARHPRRRVMACALTGKHDILGFNTEQELRRIRKIMQ